MSLNRSIVFLHEVGELQMRMRDNGEPSLMVNFLNDPLGVLIRIDGLLQIDAKDVVIFKKVANLQTGYNQKVIMFFSPAGNLIDLMEISVEVLDRYSFVINLQTPW